MARNRGSRRLRLSPLQRDLIWMLEEAGAEDLRCLVATIEPRDLQEFEHDVRALVRLGLVRFYRDLGRPDYHYVALTESEADRLPDFRDLLSEYRATLVAGIMLTKSGYAALTT